MWRMLQQDSPDDYVIATGEPNTLESFVASSFAILGLDWHDHVDIDPSLFRPSEIVHSAGNPLKAVKGLGWQATVAFPELIGNLVGAEQDIVGTLL
jgi:GDPmannose 4,6-dehydratase